MLSTSSKFGGATLAIAVAGLLASLPTLGQDIRRPPEPPSPIGLSQGPVYLHMDEDGRLFNLQVPWFDGSKWQDLAPRYYLTESDLANLQEHATKDGFEIRIVSEGNVKSTASGHLKSSGACPLPSSFNISQSSGVLSGNQVSATSNKGSGETTQWAVMVFYTSNYASKNSHAGNTLLFQDVLHGLGAIYGNNSGSSEGCTNQPYTTQLEAWAAWSGHEPDNVHFSPSDPNGTPVNYWWQNKVWGTNDSGGSSCGANMADSTTYALTVQANTNQDVAYEAKQWTGSTWSTIKSWTANNPTTPTWQWNLSSAYFDTSAAGIASWAIPTGNSSSSDDFTIHVTSFDCGWF